MDDPGYNIWPRTKSKMILLQEDKLVERGDPAVEIEIKTEEKAEEPTYELRKMKICNENPITLHDYAKFDIDFTVLHVNVNENASNDDICNEDSLNNGDTSINDSNADTSMDSNTSHPIIDINECLLREINASFTKDMGCSVGVSNNGMNSTETSSSIENNDSDKNMKNDIFHYLVTASVIDGEVAFSCTKVDVANVQDNHSRKLDDSEDVKKTEGSVTSGDKSSLNKNESQVANSVVSERECDGITSTSYSDLSQDGSDFLESETNSDMITKEGDMTKLVTLNGWQLFIHEEIKKYNADFGSSVKTMKSLWNEMGEHERKAYNVRGQIGIMLEPCEKCGRKFTNFVKRNEHVSGCGPTECQTCKKVFNDVKKMKLHATKHTHRFFCFTCNSSWETASKLRRHMQVHEKTKSYQCNICKKRYSRKDYLKFHYDNKHR